jgi:hypothetical protein
MAERSHLGAVRYELVRNGGGADEIEWQEIEIPPRNLGGRQRLLAERACCARVLKCASEAEARHLIFCSLTSEGLLWLKAMLLARRRSFGVLAVLHGVLATVEEPQPRRPHAWVTSLRQVLRMPHPKQLTYLALGPTIHAHIAETLPRAASFFKATDPPYFMPGPGGITVRQPLRFGFLGVARLGEKRFDKFVQLAQEVARISSLAESEFVLVGFLGDDVRAIDGVAEAIRHTSSTPASPEEYDARASELTYVVGMADPGHYRLVASASFLDALRYGKPGIYLRNPYLEHYFQRLGDIGYLCDSDEEVREVVFSILKAFPETRYRQQCENITRGRRIFEPYTLAGTLANLLAEAERRARFLTRAKPRSANLASRPQEGPEPQEGVKL